MNLREYLSATGKTPKGKTENLLPISTLEQDAIDSQAGDGFGLLTFPQFLCATMPFIPTGSDGGDPVFEVVSDRKQFGIEPPCMEDDDV